VDPKGIKSISLAYATSKKIGEIDPIVKSFLFDLKNPWAFWIELNSTHPLIAKRIKRLNDIQKLKCFDFEEMERVEIDKSRLYAGFFKDLFISLLPYISFFSMLILLVFLLIDIIPFISITSSTIFLLFLLSFPAALGISLVIKGLYKYPKGKAVKTNVLELLGDVYASPVKGKYVSLSGKLIGRGIPGLIISEDMMLQDETGIIFMNYEGLIPGISNIIFAMMKMDKLIGKSVRVKGWFLRGASPRIEVDEMLLLDEDKKIKSYLRFWAMFIGILLMVVSALLAMLFI